MGKVKELVTNQKETEMFVESNYKTYSEIPTSFMEEVYEESVRKLANKYHCLSVEEIEWINTLANKFK